MAYRWLHFHFVDPNSLFLEDGCVFVAPSLLFCEMIAQALHPKGARRFDWPCVEKEATIATSITVAIAATNFNKQSVAILKLNQVWVLQRSRNEQSKSGRQG